LRVLQNGLYQPLEDFFFYSNHFMHGMCAREGSE